MAFGAIDHGVLLNCPKNLRLGTWYCSDNVSSRTDSFDVDGGLGGVCSLPGPV